MTADMDVVSARAVVLSAADFDWTWSTDDVRRFCARTGWRIDGESQYGFIISTGIAGLGICQAASEKGVLKQIDCSISAKVEPDDLDGSAELSTAFERLTDELTLALGSPVSRTATTGPRLRWNLPHLVIYVSLTHGVVWLLLRSLEAQRQEEEWDEQLAMGPP
ncbi:DUF6301 family protein [Nocardia aurea]|uniref:DUF6301 family protein n=1 Tax=Nocardia aurea TaxID=2144174 RepID=A0ABV3FS08_9NOCA